MGKALQEAEAIRDYLTEDLGDSIEMRRAAA